MSDIQKIKDNWDSSVPEFKNKVSKILNSGEKTASNSFNPFLNKNGTLFNPYLNYQKILDSPNISQIAKKYITQATGLSPSVNSSNKAITSVGSYAEYIKSNGANSNNASGVNTNDKVNFNPNIDSKGLASLDVITELPKLSTSQIEAIITQHFGKSTVIKPIDAQGIFDAQQKTGMSALAILGIGALESGYGTSNIAKKKNNIWGWNATNSNPAGNAKTFPQMSEGAYEFANSYINTYYNGYGAKSIYSAGTGNNPSGKGYAYNDNGTISSSWASDVGSIMGKFYNTAKGVKTSSSTSVPSSKSTQGSAVSNTVLTTQGSLKVGSRIANTATYSNSAAKGQCVWYVRGRAQEKLGVKTNSMGNANEMWYNAGKAKVSASVDNIKPNMIVSYKYGTTEGGKKYGHVIYIEDVVGDTVYYTEGGSGYYKNGTDGVVKTATKQGILKGVNTNGKSMGSNVIGFIDVTKL